MFRRMAAATLALCCTSVSQFAIAADATVQLPPPVVNGTVWKPQPYLRWQLQFATTPIDVDVDADVFKIDLFDNAESVVSDLKDRGKHVVCYVNAGAWEDWRPDAKSFPKAVMGRRYEGWPGERWLDVRRIDLLAPVLLARLDLCRDKGFHGVMFDNVDGYMQKTGFPISSADQLRFNAWIANEARNRGLAAGINNNAGQAAELMPYYDWALAESCFSQGWCARLKSFAEEGKAVVVIEYTEDQTRLNAMCKAALALRFTLLAKKRELDAYRKDCGVPAGHAAR
jgi:hypothetical protein